MRTKVLLRENFFLFFLYSILLYMEKLSNTVNHFNKLILTYFFRAVFINLYFKTKHLDDTFYLRFYSLSNTSVPKHISSKSNISVLTISGKSRNIKIIAPSPRFIINSPILWYSFNIPWRSFYYEPPFYDIFLEHPLPCLFDSPFTIKHRRVHLAGFFFIV